MTIHPEQVVYRFGVPLAAEVLARPMRIIAPVFRDVGQTNAGLTDAVEEVAGAAMRGLCAREGHFKRLPQGGMAASVSMQREAAAELRKERMIKVLRQMAIAPITRQQLSELTGLGKGSACYDFERCAADMDFLTRDKSSRPWRLVITDAGRAFLRFSEGA